MSSESESEASSNGDQQIVPLTSFTLDDIAKAMSQVCLFKEDESNEDEVVFRNSGEAIFGVTNNKCRFDGHYAEDNVDGCSLDVNDGDVTSDDLSFCSVSDSASGGHLPLPHYVGNRCVNSVIGRAVSNVCINSGSEATSSELSTCGQDGDTQRNAASELSMQTQICGDVGNFQRVLDNNQTDFRRVDHINDRNYLSGYISTPQNEQDGYVAIRENDLVCSRTSQLTHFYSATSANISADKYAETIISKRTDIGEDDRSVFKYDISSSTHVRDDESNSIICSLNDFPSNKRDTVHANAYLQIRSPKQSILASSWHELLHLFKDEFRQADITCEELNRTLREGKHHHGQQKSSQVNFSYTPSSNASVNLSTDEEEKYEDMCTVEYIGDGEEVCTESHHQHELYHPISKFKKITKKKIENETKRRRKLSQWTRTHNNFNLSQRKLKEPVRFLRKAQLRWERRITAALNLMSNELQTPLSRHRISPEKEDVNMKWNELSTYESAMMKNLHTFLKMFRQMAHERSGAAGKKQSEAVVAGGRHKQAAESSERLKSLYSMFLQCPNMKSQKALHRPWSKLNDKNNLVRSFSRFNINQARRYRRKSKKSNLEWKMIAGYLESVSGLSEKNRECDFSGDGCQRMTLFDKDSNDQSTYKPVYSPNDFLDVLMWIRCRNYKYSDREDWNFTTIPLPVRTLAELKVAFLGLAQGEGHTGIDKYIPSPFGFYPSMEAERTLIMLVGRYASLAPAFLKKGCPKSLRGRIWSHVLGSELTSHLSDHFKKLKKLVVEYDLMIDRIIIKDVQVTSGNDSQYFVFEETLYQVLLCFFRDTDVLEVFMRSSSNPQVAILRGKHSASRSAVIYPPCGIVPFHGFTMYASPFCYLYDNAEQVYMTFRAFYMRYLFRLHEVSSHPQSILCLCELFQKLLEYHEPVLSNHFKKNEIKPVHIAFKWIMRAFSGYLLPEQLLRLWDLILAFDTIEVIPILAAGIFSLRKNNLIRVKTSQGTEGILADLTTINIVSVIQATLQHRQ